MQNKFFIFIISFFFLANIYSQDAVFTRFNSNPLYTSAALTGAFNGKYRVGTSIRRQWINIVDGSLYSTKTVFADKRFNFIKNDYLSLGILFWDDLAGSNQIKLGSASGLLSISYAKHLYQNKYNGQNQYLVFGIQFGYGKRYFSNGDYLFGIQFDKNTQAVNPDIPNSEPLLNSRLYPDINSGLMYYISNRQNSFYIGANIKHINKANISLLKTSDFRLYRLYFGIIGGEITLNKNISMLPSAIFNLQGPHTLLVIGSSIRYRYFNENNAFRIGVWAKLPNSLNGILLSEISLATGFEYNHYEIGISYDITVSKLINITGHRGAFELTFIYKWGSNPRNTPINCPRF